MLSWMQWGTTDITSPSFIVVKAADEFKDKTTAPNQLWQTDFTYLKVTGSPLVANRAVPASSCASESSGGPTPSLTPTFQHRLTVR